MLSGPTWVYRDSYFGRACLGGGKLLWRNKKGYYGNCSSNFRVEAAFGSEC